MNIYFRNRRIRGIPAYIRRTVAITRITRALPATLIRRNQRCSLILVWDRIFKLTTSWIFFYGWEDCDQALISLPFLISCTLAR